MSTICVKHNSSEIPDRLNWSSFAKISQLNSDLGFWLKPLLHAGATMRQLDTLECATSIIITKG